MPRATHGGEGGIRTHVPELPDHPISSRRRYDHFGTSPAEQFRAERRLLTARSAAPFCGGGILAEAGDVRGGLQKMRRGARWPRSLAAPQVARLAGLTAAAVLLASCTPAPPALEQIRARHELRVVTLNLPTCYYLGSQGTEGLEFELARSFAAKLGVNSFHVSGGE